MRTFTREELQEIVRQHNEWLRDSGKGKRADLSWSNLIGSDLSWSDLRGSNLSGSNLIGSDLSWSKTDKHYIQVSCIGSRKGMTTYCYDDDKIWCGCWQGTLKDFAGRVKKTYPNKKSIYRREYEGFIKFIRAVK